MENELTHTQQTTNESNALPIAVIALIIAAASLFIGITNRQTLSSGVVAAGGPDAFYAESAEQAGIKSKTFDTCLASAETAQKVRDDINEAVAHGGQGTPFSILVTPNGKQIPVSGALPAELFLEIINLLESDSKEDLDAIFAEITRGELTETPELSDSTLRLFDPMVDHYRGPEDAKYMLIEYSDFECPYCAQAHRNFERLLELRDDIVWVYRHLPLESIHPNAEPAARASECIADLSGNDAFWEFADVIFADPSVFKN